MKRLFAVLAFAAGSAHAQQGVYVTLPPIAQPRQSTLVSDVAKSYSAHPEPSSTVAEAPAEPGRAPSVVEVSPGVVQFDVGIPASVVPKAPSPVVGQTAEHAPVASSSGPAAGASDMRSIAPPEWRIGIYGGSQASYEPQAEAPAGPVAVAPLASIRTPSSVANSAGASADSGGKGAGQGVVAPAATQTISPKLPDWPVVR